MAMGENIGGLVLDPIPVQRMETKEQEVLYCAMVFVSCCSHGNWSMALSGRQSERYACRSAGPSCSRYEPVGDI